MKPKLQLISLSLLLLLAFAFGLPRQGRPQRAPLPAPASKPVVTFEEVPAKSSGIRWTHNNAHSSDRYLPETVGAGCAFFDYDNDGWMDIYLVNSGASDFFTPTAPLKNALYRNNRDGTFTDVTDKSGATGGRFGMGVAAGDYDSDGFQDIYVTNYGRNILYRNNGDGTFTDVTEKAGVAAPGWSTCAVWFDYDADGKLDLFVSSFVFYDKTQKPFCTDAERSRHYYCVPKLFKPMPSRLFRNRGDGTFADVSGESGIAASPGKSFGAVATDVNNDGLIDLFVANDTMPNFLFVNKGAGKFEEAGLAAGVAYGETGRARSGMGVDAADYDGDGWQDLFVANIDQEFFSLYHNEHDLTFVDEPGEIASTTHLLSGWGLKFFDYDSDGDPDLFLANGHPDDFIEMRAARVKYREPLLLFENTGKAFRNASAESGAVFKRDYAARGMAVGDVDNDGDADVLVSNNGEAPLLLRNDGGNRNNWLGLQLVATKSNSSAVGALITWQTGGVRRSRLKIGGGSYLASHDPRELLGLGRAAKIDFIEIRWPSGRVDKLSDVPVNSYVRVVEGQGWLRSNLPAFGKRVSEKTDSNRDRQDGQDKDKCGMRNDECGMKENLLSGFNSSFRILNSSFLSILSIPVNFVLALSICPAALRAARRAV
ncbi:MAG TPA: CRTAC1 family protein [Pyrinomonadaceae bacterium]